MPWRQMPIQLSLGVSLRDEATFANFYCAEQNAAALQAVRDWSQNRGESNLVIWGAEGSGLSHLLQSCCHQAHQEDLSVLYLPLADLLGYTPEQVFDGLESCQLVCLDDVHCIAGNPQWEEALFHLYNRLRQASHRLLLACQCSPASLAIELADLRSRLLGSVVYQIHPLNDAQKCEALIQRAGNRGLELSEEVARYILARAARDTAGLFDLLETLDEASLQHQRKLTIPFVKAVLKI